MTRAHPLATFLLLAFALTWLVWVPRAAAMQGYLETDLPIVVGQVWTYGPAFAALLAAVLSGGRGAVRELGARVVRWRVGWQWYCVVIAGPAALSLVITAVYAALGGDWREAAPPAVTEGSLALIALLLLVLAITDGLGEEAGWRGYALPLLLARHSAVSASLFLGVVWALWHLPLFWTVGVPLQGASFLLVVIELPARAILFTWVFQHTNGSALLAVLFHAALNLFSVPRPFSSAGGLTPALIGLGVVWSLTIVLVVLAGRDLDRRPRGRRGAGRARVPGCA